MSRKLSSKRDHPECGVSREWFSFLGLEEMTADQLKNLQVPAWWEDVFGDENESPAPLSDAYLEAQVLHEIGECDSNGLRRPGARGRYGNLSWVAADASVKFSGIPKRNRKERRDWVGEFAFLLSRVGVWMATLQPDGRAGWTVFLDSGFAAVKQRAGDGSRVELTRDGRTFLSADCGECGKAWRVCSSGCEWFLCAMIMRLRWIYDDPRAPTRIRAVLASILSAENRMISDGRMERPLTEKQRIRILENAGLFPTGSGSELQDSRNRATYLNNLRKIRDVGNSHLGKKSSSGR